MDGIQAEILGIGVAIVGAIITGAYVLLKDNRANSKSIKEDLKEHISKIEDDMKDQLSDFKNHMETIDMRWASLFEKFHILDKDMEKFRLPSKNHP